MTIEKLVKYALQYLEQSSDTSVMDEDIEDLKTNDEFIEYLNNIEHSIYMALTRYATSEILPICEYEFSSSNCFVTDDGTINGKRLFHRIEEVYAIDSDGNIINNIKYFIIGKKVQLKEYNEDYTYYVIYHPTIMNLDYYVEKNDLESFYDIDLANLDGQLSVPDEMAINIKYLIFSDLKSEENPSLANYNKNYFENYLAETKGIQVENHQVDVVTRDWGDRYGD